MQYTCIEDRYVICQLNSFTSTLRYRTAGMDEPPDLTFPPDYPRLLKFIVEGVMIISCCGLGLLANIISLFVMSRPTLKKGRCASVNALLTSMAGVDIILLFSR